ncbi:MAG: diguanylate cyclase domain-containing protein [Candidatus Dormibacteria bacterium]
MSIAVGGARAEEILSMPQFHHVVQGFETATGLKLHAYTLAAVPLTLPVDPPRFCQLLQSDMDCPLFFDPSYHRAQRPELRRTCGGLGHVVIPIIDSDGTAIANLVSDVARFGPVDMEGVTELSFKLKIFPDDLAIEAEGVVLVDPDRAMLAAQSLFSALRELTAGEVAGARALSGLARALSQAEPDAVPGVLVSAALDFTGAEFAFVRLNDEAGAMLAEESSLAARQEWWRVLQGTAEWVLRAGRAVDLTDVSQSAWCRHLAGSVPPPAALTGMPLMNGSTVYGALVVGGTDRSELGTWSAALGVLTTSAADGLVLARRLLQSHGGMVDPGTGAYSLRFLEELLEKEISRAGRHQHDLSVVLFHIANHADLISTLGPEAAEAALAQMAEMLRGKTRKVNSLARINGADFALVIPEAGVEVAKRIAGELGSFIRAETIPLEVAGASRGVRFNMETRAVTNPREVRAIMDLVASPN